MKNFTQAYISNVLPHFKEGFLNKWKLEEYNDPNKPSVFLGLYSQEDVNNFLNHKSYKIISLGGNDMHSPQLNLLKKVVDFKTTFYWQAPGTPSDIAKQYNIPHKELYIAMKDYSNLTPTPLGENIYVYMGSPNNQRLEYFKYREIIHPLVEVFGKSRVKWVFQKESSPLSMNKLIENYYNDCFVYIKPNNLGGATSMWELAHMGRRTLGNGFPDLNYVSEYSDIYNLIDLIMEESKYMGNIREDVANEAKKTFIGEEWLSLNYWL